MRLFASFVPMTALIPLLAMAQGETSVQEKVKLRLASKAGELTKYTVQATITPVETSFPFEVKMTMKMEDKVLKVLPDGNTEIETKMTGGTLSFGEQETEMPGDAGVRKSTIGPDGITISKSGETWDEEFDLRLTRAIETPYPKNEVAVGETWQFEHKADPERGWRGGTVTAKLLAIEVIDGIRCAKIEHRFKEKPFRDDAGSYDCMMTYWIDLASGGVVRGEGVLQGFVNQQMGSTSPMKMTMKISRTK